MSTHRIRDFRAPSPHRFGGQQSPEPTPHRQEKCGRVIRRLAALVALAGLAGAPACRGAADVARTVTYGPDLRYLEPARVSAVMRDFTKTVVALQRQLRVGPPTAPEGKESLRRHLDALDALARALDTGGRRSNHPVLDQNLPRFRQLLEEARRNARAEPPNYFLAESLAGSCLLCHSKR